MAVLSFNEGAVIEELRKVYGTGAFKGEPVPVHVVKYRALNYHGVRYDGVDRALRGLMDKGMVKKPRRGFYVPVTLAPKETEA